MTSTTIHPTQSVPDPGPAAPSLSDPRELLPYHRQLATSGKRRVWLPLALVAMSSVLAAVFVALSMVPFALIPGVNVESEMFGTRMDDPIDMTWGLLCLAVLTPAVLLTWRIFGGRGRAHSVFGRFRWELVTGPLRLLLPLAVLLIAVPTLLAYDRVMPTLDWRLFALLAITLALVPLQAAGEEYFFRALPMQALGVWFKTPWVGILLPVPLFALAHDYSAWGLAAVAVFAVCAGVLTWRTKGIELAVLLHAVNNLTLFLIAPVVPAVYTQTEVGPGAAVYQVAFTVILTGLLLRWYAARPAVARTA